MIICISNQFSGKEIYVLVPTSLVKFTASSPLIKLIASPSRTYKSYVKIVVMVRATMTIVIIISSVRSSYSHPDLLLTQHQHPTFSDHTGPQHWTFTF